MMSKLSRRIKTALRALIACPAFLFLASLSAVPVYAQMEQERQDGDMLIGGNTANPSELFIGLLKVIFFLILIIGLIYLTVRFLASKNQTLFGKRSVRVITGVQLAPNKTVQMIKLGDSVYVLGVGDDVQLLDKITDPEQVTAILEQIHAEDAKPLTSTFDWMGKLRSRFRRRDEWNAQPSFQDLLRERLDQASSEHRTIEDLLADYEQDGKERSKQ